MDSAYQNMASYGNGGQGNQGGQCVFPPPAADRVACQAAPFVANGMHPYQPLVRAYGSSRPRNGGQ